MAARTTTSELEFLRREWDRQARAARPDADYFRSGDRDVARDIAPHLTAHGSALDIGCGAGRMTRALSRVFETVYAVDVSSEMVSLARTALQDVPNVHLFQNDGRSLEMVREPLDCAVAYGVFPHLSRESMENYAGELWDRLRPGGAFVFEIPTGFEWRDCGYELLRRESDARPYDLVWSVRAGTRG
jgi:SAM-dependent methyltransferase